MKPSRITPNVDLTTFRKANGLTQTAVSEYLSVSRSFINQVENGKVSMPRHQMDKLFQNNQWDTSELVPAYTRIVRVQKEFAEQNLTERLSEIIDNERLERLKYGEIAVTEDLAEKIVRLFAKRQFNMDWLMEGKKPVFKNKKPNLQEQIDEIKSLQEQSIELMRNLTDEIKRLQEHLGLTEKPNRPL